MGVWVRGAGDVADVNDSRAAYWRGRAPQHVPRVRADNQHRAPAPPLDGAALQATAPLSTVIPAGAPADLTANDSVAVASVAQMSSGRGAPTVTTGLSVVVIVAVALPLPPQPLPPVVVAVSATA
jgi:hypothetical protein